MNRRDFLGTSAAGLALAASQAGAQPAAQPSPRVGLIGCGWYGKSDLLRLVQVGTQRRSTPHIIDARDRVIRAGLLGQVKHVEIYCYYQMRARGNPPDAAPPANLDYEMWTGPAPMRPYNSLVHPRSWRAFMEYGNGIVGDMCIHMLDMVRWQLGLGWPRRISSTGGILVDRNSKANITDTQSALF